MKNPIVVEVKDHTHGLYTRVKVHLIVILLEDIWRLIHHTFHIRLSSHNSELHSTAHEWISPSTYTIPANLKTDGIRAMINISILFLAAIVYKHVASYFL